MNKSEATTYPVIEIFESIQGEGILSGFWVTFVRLAGCNLRCPWCDTKESWDPETNIEQMTSKEIADKVKTSMVVITGGEPTIHPLKRLIKKLHQYDKMVIIETNGTKPIPKDWNVDRVVCSPKPPKYEIHPECIFHELKYVVDNDFTIDKIYKPAIAQGMPITLQVESCKRESVEKILTILPDNPNMRLGVQLHKMLDLK